jgi:2-polyprenyl-3-methyl-5-hydroxy-6-metoxy-1,4-benzoquinol methylase
MQFNYKLNKKLRYYYFKLANRIDYSSINIRKIDFNSINRLCTEESNNRKNLLNHVLTYKSEMVGFNQEGERAFPGDPIYLSSGHYAYMLNRYLFAGLFFSKGMKILDSCSGLGWGSYIISHYAKKVFAFDSNPQTIDFCKTNWGEKNIRWLTGDALDISFLKNEKFDCVLAMETIEHFSKDDAERYISNLNNLIKKGGFLVGTTPIINIREKVDEHLHSHPYHMHIFSYDELKSLLQKYFSEVTIIKDWMFIAKN